MTFLKAPSVFRTQQRPNKNEYETWNTIFVQQTVFKIVVSISDFSVTPPPQHRFFWKSSEIRGAPSITFFSHINICPEAQLLLNCVLVQTLSEGRIHSVVL